MAKTLVMVTAMAALFAATTACFGLFDRGSEKPRAEVACESMTGQAKIDCERQRASQGH